MPGFHHSVAVLALVNSQSACWSVHTERRFQHFRSHLHATATVPYGRYGRTATEWWKPGIMNAVGPDTTHPFYLLNFLFTYSSFIGIIHHTETQKKQE